MSFDLAHLPWLLPVPTDFRLRCRNIEALESGWGPALRGLAQHALNDSNLMMLSRTLHNVRAKAGGAIPALQTFSLGIISNATTKLVAPALTATALRYGINLEIVEAEFNQVMQAAVSPDSKVISRNPDAIMFMLDHNAFQSLGSGLNSDSAAAIEYLAGLRDGLRQHFKGALIFQSVPCPPDPFFGSYDILHNM